MSDSSTPRISIVTPSFNQAAYLEETLCSVLDQGYPDLEYIVIDAASTDGSIDVIRRHEDGLAYWVSEPDRGHADGLNKGFTRCTGDIMGWVNSSDVYLPWTLETVAQVFCDVPEAHWVMGVPAHYAETGGPKNIAPRHWNLYDVLSGNYQWIQQESVFWRRSLWEASGGTLDPSVRLACDFDLWLRFFGQAPLCHVNTVLAGFRSHDEQRGREGAEAYAREAAEVLQRFSALVSPRDRRRGALVRATNSFAGRCLRDGLRHLGGWRWYSHPVIEYSYPQRRWVMARDLR